MNFTRIFRRQITAGKSYMPEIDGLRFVAIMTVLLFHLYEFFIIKNKIVETNWWSLPFENGAQGVQLFFIISGFILAIPFAKKYPRDEKISLKAFFLKRITRLEPPYIISLLVFFTIIIVRNQREFGDLIWNLLASIFYVHNIVFGKGSDINTVAWSLEVEIQFYILVPILALVFRKTKTYRRVFILLLIITSLIINILFDVYFRTLIAQFHYFLIGMLIADLYVNDEPIKIQQSIFGFLGLTLVLLVNREHGHTQEILFIIGSTLLFMSALYNQFWKRVFSINYIALIGGMCYSIYLLHYPIISAVGNFFFQRNIFVTINGFIPFMLILSLVTLIISALFFLIVEKPCMNNDWPKQLKSFLKKK